MNKFALASLTLGLLGLAPSLALAKQRPQNPVADAPPQNVDFGQHTAQMRRSTVTGAPLAWYAVDYAVDAAAPETMARQFLRDQAATLGLRDPALADLAHRHSRIGPAGVNVHFDQSTDGVPVYQGRIVVHISPDNRVTHVASGYRPDAALPQKLPLLSSAQATLLVATAIGARGPYQFERAVLMAYPGLATTHLAWRVNLVPSAPAGDWEGLIDALSGEILALWNSAPHATGVAFTPDPLGSSGTRYGNPITDAGDSDYPEIAAEVMTVELGELTARGGLLFLSDEWAELGDFEAPLLGQFAQAAPDFVFNREQAGFEATNVFYHLRESMRYINQTLGLDVRPYQYPGGVQFDPHGVNGDDNSHYVPSTGRVAFGEGCVDDSEDADVIWHELAHGLHDWVTVGGLSNLIDGLSEGFGDYWAQSYSRSLGQWQPEDAEYDWVFSWDGHNECWAGRVTNYALPWPVGVTPYPLIHTSGQIWSTCLMQVYDQIGRETTDAITLEGLAMTNAVSTQNDAANAVLQAALDMGLPDEVSGVVADTFASCGYLVALTAAGLGTPQANEAGIADSGEFDRRSADPAGSGAPGWVLALAAGALLRRRQQASAA